MVQKFKGAKSQQKIHGITQGITSATLQFKNADLLFNNVLISSEVSLTGSKVIGHVDY